MMSFLTVTCSKYKNEYEKKNLKKKNQLKY